MMSEHGAYLDSTFISLVQRIESASETGLSDLIVDNLRQTVSRGKQVYAWARKYDVPIAFGTDLWGPEAQECQLREFEIRMELDAAYNIIRSATITNAALLMQEGKLGTIAVGACADLLVVDGDPLADVRVMLNPKKNLKFIMKDGIIYKNELD
jgi:imidazolonepropionase-like amidohydrolase